MGRKDGKKCMGTNLFKPGKRTSHPTQRINQWTAKWGSISKGIWHNIKNAGKWTSTSSVPKLPTPDSKRFYLPIERSRAAAAPRARDRAHQLVGCAAKLARDLSNISYAHNADIRRTTHGGRKQPSCAVQ